VIIAEIAVRQNIIANALAVAQAAATADHDPAFRPQHREMVCDRLRV